MASKNKTRLEKIEQKIPRETETKVIRITNQDNLTDEDWQRMIKAGQVIRIKVNDHDNNKSAY